MKLVARLALGLCCVVTPGLGCRSTPALPRVDVSVAADPALDDGLTKRWMTELSAHEQSVAVDKSVHVRVWQDMLDETPVLYLGVAWPEGWLTQPLHTPLASPVKLGVALDAPSPASTAYPAALSHLLDLFWVQVELAQSPWPIPAQYLDSPYPVAVRSMTADWLGRYGRPDPALAQGCLALLEIAMAKPRDPELGRLESSVACLAKVGQASQVPKILDRMPNGHLRVEMARVELLGALGGPLAVDQLRWVKEQAQEAALVRAAELALAGLASSAR